MTTAPEPPPVALPAPVTVIGLGRGNLGRAIAGTLLRDVHPVTFWNRSPARAEPLVTRGATAAATAAEAIAAADLVIVALLDSPAAREVLTGAAGAVRGRTLVNLTSGDPEDARALAAWAAEHGAEYLHGAVYAVPQTIGTAQASVSYSGSPDVHRRWRAPLDLVGKGTFLGADAGRASGYDVAVLAGMYSMLGGFFTPRRWPRPPASARPNSPRGWCPADRLVPRTGLVRRGDRQRRLHHRRVQPGHERHRPGDDHPGQPDAGHPSVHARPPQGPDRPPGRRRPRLGKPRPRRRTAPERPVSGT